MDSNRTASYTTNSTGRAPPPPPPPSFPSAAVAPIVVLSPLVLLPSIPSLVPRTLTSDRCGGGRGILIGSWCRCQLHTPLLDLTYHTQILRQCLREWTDRGSGAWMGGRMQPVLRAHVSKALRTRGVGWRLTFPCTAGRGREGEGISKRNSKLPACQQRGRETEK